MDGVHEAVPEQDGEAEDDAGRDGECGDVAQERARAAPASRGASASANAGMPTVIAAASESWRGRNG